MAEKTTEKSSQGLLNWEGGRESAFSVDGGSRKEILNYIWSDFGSVWGLLKQHPLCHFKERELETLF